MDYMNENPTDQGHRLTTRFASAVAALTVMIGLGLAFGAGAASAAPSVDPTLPLDPSGGSIDTTWAAIQTFVLGKGAALLFGLTGLGILIRVAWKYLRRGSHAV
jgi:hypothetical protein